MTSGEFYNFLMAANCLDLRQLQLPNVEWQKFFIGSCCCCQLDDSISCNKFNKFFSFFIAGNFHLKDLFTITLSSLLLPLVSHDGWVSMWISADFSLHWWWQLIKQFSATLSCRDSFETIQFVFLQFFSPTLCADLNVSLLLHCLFVSGIEYSLSCEKREL